MQISLGYAVLVLVIYVLAVMRLTRLVNSDQITDRLRLIPARRQQAARNTADEALRSGQTIRAELIRKTQNRWGEIVYLLSCPWCVGLWAALLTAYLPVWVIGWPWWAFVPVGLAVSQVIGMCAPLFNDEEIETEEVEH